MKRHPLEHPLLAVPLGVLAIGLVTLAWAYQTLTGQPRQRGRP